MRFEIPNFTAAMPEIFVLIMACVVLMAGLFAKPTPRGQQINYYLTQLTLIIATVLTLWVMPNSGRLITFNGLFILDDIAVILKLFIYLTAFLAFLYGREYLVPRNIPQHEYYVLGLFSVLGMMVMVSANSLLTVYMGLELLSLPLYAMVAMQRENTYATEAAMKYFVMGALASGMLLYGMSLVYGATGSIDLTIIVDTIAANNLQNNTLLVFGSVLLIAGLAFKLGSAPFHMWVPDVYQGAPTAVTTFLSAAPKIAAFGISVRILFNALPLLSEHWQELLIIIAILSMGIGNFIAIVQTNLKRMLGFSAIAHAGYMLLGFVAIEPFGFASAMFYMITYAFTSVAAFGILTILSRGSVEIAEISDLKGLNSRNPWLAFMLLIVMFSMAGIPPTVGFFAKMGVLEALIRVNLSWLAAVALLFAIVGAYYYIRVVKVMYFEEPDVRTAFKTSKDATIAISANGILIVLLGLFPSTLIALCRAAFGVL